MTESSPRYRLASDSFGSEEIEAATATLRSGRYTMGEQVIRFEQELAKWLGVKETIMVNSGSSANLLLVEALLRRCDPSKSLLKVGDEVLVPALSWPTTVWPLVQLGLVPVFVDIDPLNLAIDLESCARVITKKTRGLFLIHVLGQACSMKKYVDFCKEHNLVLFEDCCESFGAYDQEKHVGSFGFGGTLSHFYSHHLTTMEGGSLLVNDPDLANDLRSLRAHGWLRDRTDKDKFITENPELDPRFAFVMTGYNVRPMEVQAAIGLVQLPKMDEFILKREQNVLFVNDLIKRHTPWIKIVGAECLPQKAGVLPRQKRKHSWMNIPFVVDPSSKLKVREVQQTLEESGVDTRPIIAGNLTRHPAMRNMHHRVDKTLKNSDLFLENGFMIGCHPLVDEQSFEILNNAFKKLGQKS